MWGKPSPAVRRAQLYPLFVRLMKQQNQGAQTSAAPSNLPQYPCGGTMGKFILGVIVTLLVLVLGGLGAAMLGIIPTNANVAPPHFETRIAMAAVDASMERHAPRVTNPVTPTDQNLEDGMKVYTMNCA